MNLNRNSTPHGQVLRGGAGLTLLEIMIAVVVAGIGISGIMAMTSGSLLMARSVSESKSASMILQQRIEQLRATGWNSVVDATSLANRVEAMSGNTAGFTLGSLGSVVETAIISDYPDQEIESMLVSLTHSENGASIKIDKEADFSSVDAVQVVWSLQWTDPSGRERTRETSTIISNIGVMRDNLPVGGGGDTGGGDTGGGDTGGGDTGGGDTGGGDTGGGDTGGGDTGGGDTGGGDTGGGDTGGGDTGGGDTGGGDTGGASPPGNSGSNPGKGGGKGNVGGKGGKK